MLDPLLTAAEGGRFVHVTDERAGQPFFGAYGASKAAAEAFVRSWAEETRKIPPTVSLFSPAPMPTALRARFYPGEDRSALTDCETEARRLLDGIGLA
jgi:NAD(P)-dependent dehydrogenase (short-subunit alcohol dehydrogenase family)